MNRHDLEDVIGRTLLLIALGCLVVAVTNGIAHLINDQWETAWQFQNVGIALGIAGCLTRRYARKERVK